MDMIGEEQVGFRKGYSTLDIYLFLKATLLYTYERVKKTVVHFY